MQEHVWVLPKTTRIRLAIQRPHRPLSRVVLDRHDFVIGRDPACDLVVPDGSASRQHARIRREESGFLELIDLGSKNGTWVDDVRIGTMQLIKGDQFRIGETHFIVEYDEDVIINISNSLP